ncbi:MAG: hypothetical protein WCR30_02055 [Clostridia bacterium]
MKFSPKTTMQMDLLLNDNLQVRSLVDCFSSPLNIIFPQSIENNILECEKVFKKFSIKGHIYFAHKCNKSDAIINQMINSGVNVDVASVNELKHSLSCGFVGKHIEATGPKNDDFILLGLRHNILFNVDNFEELQTLLNFHKAINKKDKTKLLIRLCGFKSGATKFLAKQSRFGIDIEKIDTIFDFLKENKDIFEFVGFSFHLDTVNLNEKIVAIENVINLFSRAYELELNPYIINIGGGFKVSYLKNGKEWNESVSELKEDIISGNNKLTWNKASFGLHSEQGVLRGGLNIYNYYEESVKEKFLNDILSARLEKYQNRMVGEILSENMIELAIEPGRSLLDGAGLTLAEVVFSKNSSSGDNLIGASMNRSNLLIGEQEMFVDPILIGKSENETNKDGFYLLGNLCLESDLIFKHKVFIDKLPKKGDILAFVNTAGYFMDFSQSETIMHNVAKKIVAVENNGKLNFFLDENFDSIKQKVKNESK